MKIVLQNYDAQIAALSVRKYRDERGNTYFGIDEDIRDRLRSRLIRAVLDFQFWCKAAAYVPLSVGAAHQSFLNLDKESGAR